MQPTVVPQANLRLQQSLERLTGGNRAAIDLCQNVVDGFISIDMENEYFRMIRTRWGFALQEVFSELPNPNW